MIPKTSFDAQSAQITTHPDNVLKIEWRGGDSAATTGLFLQVHDSVTDAAAGAVPVKSWPLIGGVEGYKEFKKGALTLNLGCFVAVSSTEATYTASTGNDKFAMLSVELFSPEVPTGTTFVGDLTTAVTGLQVWSEAAGTSARKRLLSLEVDGTNLTTATQYIMLFATDTVNTGDYPLQTATFPIGVGAVLTGETALHFGELGWEMRSYDGTNWHYGCTVKISSTAPKFTAPNGTAAIKAEYK